MSDSGANKSRLSIAERGDKDWDGDGERNEREGRDKESHDT